MAYFGEELGGGPSAASIYILNATPDAFHRLLIIQAFPFQGRGQNVIERNIRVLPMTPGVVFQLGLALRFEANRFHWRDFSLALHAS